MGMLPCFDLLIPPVPYVYALSMFSPVNAHNVVLMMVSKVNSLHIVASYISLQQCELYTRIHMSRCRKSALLPILNGQYDFKYWS